QPAARHHGRPPARRRVTGRGDSSRATLSCGSFPNRGGWGRLGAGGIGLRVQTARWMAGCAAAVSVALIAGALLLAYADRGLLPGDLRGGNSSAVFDGVANLAVPVVGFVLASRRPANRLGWLFLVAGLGLGLGGFSGTYGRHALVAVPGSWPAGRAFAWLS